MSRQQRLVFAALAAVIAVVAVIVLAGGGDEETTTVAPEPTAAATTAPAEQETPEGAEPAQASPGAAAGPTLKAGSEQTIEAKQGETVSFSVASDKDDEVHVHGYDIKKDVKAGESVEFSFEAKLTGIFEIELEEAGTSVGQLKVEP